MNNMLRKLVGEEVCSVTNYGCGKYIYNGRVIIGSDLNYVATDVRTYNLNDISIPDDCEQAVEVFIENNVNLLRYERLITFLSAKTKNYILCQ